MRVKTIQVTNIPTGLWSRFVRHCRSRRMLVYSCVVDALTQYLEREVQR